MLCRHWRSTWLLPAAVSKHVLADRPPGTAFTKRAALLATKVSTSQFHLT